MSGYKKGIDVSEHNGVIDWEKAKGSGVAFAMLRAGYGRTADKQFRRNAAECNRIGLPIGVYWFSYALSAAGAGQEAAVCLETIGPYQIDFPVAFDLEYAGVSYAREKGVYIGPALASDMARSFCGAIQAAGYPTANYANPDYLRRYFDADVQKDFPVWLAQWPGGTPSLDKPPSGCAIWQYSDRGSVPGLIGPVDLDVCYVDCMTKKEEKEQDTMTYYKQLEDVPEYYKAAVNKAMDKGGLTGTGGGALDVSEDVCRVLTILDRMGKLD